MAALIETLRQEHRDIARLLDALEHQIDVFEEAGAPDYDVITGIADYFLEYPNRCHHPKEDVVFTALQEHNPKEADRIGDLWREHRIVSERAHLFADTMRALLNDAEIARSVIVNAARQFIEAERRHMAMEETDFLPTAERVLTAQEWAAIETSLANGRESFISDKVEDQFHKLSERLLAWERE